MTTSRIEFLVAIGALWVVALLMTGTRNLRFLTFLLFPSLVVAWAGMFLAGEAGRVVQFIGLVVGATLFLLSDQLGLGSLSGADLAADATLRRLFEAFGDPGNPGDRALILNELPELERGVFSVQGDPWAHAARLFRLYVARMDEPEPDLPRPGSPPVSAYRRAGIHYWRFAYWRRVIGRNQPPSAWDEAVLLWACSEGQYRLIPGAALVEEPLTPIGGWDVEADQLVEQTRSLRLIHPASIELQRLLVESMSSVLALARGDRSDAARARQSAAAKAVTDAWPRLAPTGTSG